MGLSDLGVHTYTQSFISAVVVTFLTFCRNHRHNSEYSFGDYPECNQDCFYFQPLRAGAARRARLGQSVKHQTWIVQFRGREQGSAANSTNSNWSRPPLYCVRRLDLLLQLLLTPLPLLRFIEAVQYGERMLRWKQNQTQLPVMQRGVMFNHVMAALTLCPGNLCTTTRICFVKMMQSELHDICYLSHPVLTLLGHKYTVVF